MLYPDSDPIYKYCELNSQQPSELYRQLDRETHLTTLHPQMIAGHLQGRFLAMLSQMIKPTYILEIGTFTGYSALCLAEGLAEGGKLITVESNVELKHFTEKYFQESGMDSKIACIYGNALEIIPQLDYLFDMVWIDAAKPQYADYYNLCFDKVNKGGFILADNVLWDGKVLKDNQDLDTEALKEFNKMIAADSRVEQIVLPFRDGINIMRKR